MKAMTSCGTCTCHRARHFVSSNLFVSDFVSISDTSCQSLLSGSSVQQFSSIATSLTVAGSIYLVLGLMFLRRNSKLPAVQHPPEPRPCFTIEALSVAVSIGCHLAGATRAADDRSSCCFLVAIRTCVELAERCRTLRIRGKGHALSAEQNRH